MVSTRSKLGSNILTLDTDASFEARYYAEGAANVVFEISSLRGPRAKGVDFGDPGTSTEHGIPKIDPRLEGKLLRLRKDLPSVAPVIESQQHFEEQIEPLFPAGTLVEQVLCKITPQFIEKCNKELRSSENERDAKLGIGRPRKRWGTYLAVAEPHATLITDMRYDDEHASTEFKPKWLAQSPSAPPGSKRCRTCALRAMRNVKENKKPEAIGVSTDFCPLSLVSDSEAVVATAVEPILLKSRGAPLHMVSEKAYALPYLHNLPLLRLLRDLQVKKDPKGILKADPSNLDFMTAMTLRDCTFFLKVGALHGLPLTDLTHSRQIPDRDHSDARVEARLGDLDLKTLDGNKADYWRETEQQLIDEGWYTKTEKVPGPKASCVCFLSKQG
ncbi:MAG: hypothetical protein Q9181_007799 [Wetmoreana brouardii]